MGTEKFIAFKEDGTAYRLKGRILRYLDNEPVSEGDKANIRSTLSVPASGEGLTPANNLSDLSNAATARANLSVNSIAEDAEANGTKLLGPSIYFDGNDFIEIADDQRLSFTNGTDDLPFTVSAWINMQDATGFPVIAKHGTSTAVREWNFVANSNDKLAFTVLSTDGSNQSVVSDSALTAYEGQWIHVAASYAGAGPSAASGNAFTAANSGMTIYVNGEVASSTGGFGGTFVGMSDTSQPVYVGRYSSLYAEGHIRNVSIFNRELTAAEVADLAKGNELGFADQWAGALGGTYTSNFTSDSTNGWTAAGGSADATTTVGGDADVLQLTIDSATTNHQLILSQLDVGKNYRVTAEVYIPSTNASVDGIEINSNGNAGANIFATTTTQDAWTALSGESVAGATSLRVRMKAGSSYSFLGNGADYIAIRNVKVTQLGTLADFRSERFDSSTGKWYDLSDNAFVGTTSTATLVGREVPVYETGTWTPTVTFGGGSTGVTYTAADGYYTRVGDICFVRGGIILSSKGSDTGTWKINNLPYDSTSAGINSSLAQVYMTTAAGLTSLPFGLFDDGGNGITLLDNGATGATVLTDANAQNTTTIRFSGTYKIQ